MASVKIITSNAGIHRVHIDIPVKHRVTFVQDVMSKHPNGSAELQKQFDSYAQDYARGYMGRPQWIAKQNEIDVTWNLQENPTHERFPGDDDAGIRYFDCTVTFPVIGTCRLVRDVECDFDAVALGKRLQEIADGLEAAFLRDNRLVPIEEQPVELIKADA